MRGLFATGLISVAAICAVLAGIWPAQAEGSSSRGRNGFEDTQTSSDPTAFKKRREEAAKIEEEALEKLGPTYPIISPEAEIKLATAIDRYQSIVSKGGWPLVPKTKTLRTGDRDDSVIPLRARLQMTDGLDPADSDSWVFDESVAAALANFQRRHGIPPSGILDRRTFHALNVPAIARLQQLQVNLQRLRDLLVPGLPLRYVVVNSASFEMQAVNAGRVELRSRVIAGRPERQTPAVIAQIVGLNFFPYWRVPDSVAFGDLIPKAAKDPSFLIQERIRVLTDWGGQEIDPRSIDWRSPNYLNIKFKQDPGPQNALGLVRVDMPNEHNVYMHDTPMKNLFGRSSRAFSAGCVRVHRIFDFVTWLAAANGDWDRARVDSVLQGGAPFDVKLNEPVSVYFVYLTAWASPTGEPHFRADIYDRDGAGDMSGREDREDREARSLMSAQSLAP